MSTLASRPMASNGTGARMSYRSQLRAAATALASASAADPPEEDDLEELHYGPGFVSRVRNRYLSVAMRNTANRATVTIRRTASLEDFLNAEAKSSAGTSASHAPASKPQLRTTVSSSALISSPAPAPPAPAVLTASVMASAVPTTAPPSSAPPKESSAPTSNSSASKGIFAKSASVQRNPRVSSHLKPRRRESIQRAQSVEVLAEDEDDNVDHVVEATPAIVRSGESAVSPTRRPMFRRRSAGVAVMHNDLPAPDTVKETRKLFESRCKPAPMAKSSSTSSLMSRSRSVEATAAARSVGRRPSSPSPVRTKPVLPAKPAHLTTPTRNTPSPTVRLVKPEAKTSAFPMPTLRSVPKTEPKSTIRATTIAPKEEPPKPLIKYHFAEPPKPLDVAPRPVAKPSSRPESNYLPAAHSDVPPRQVGVIKPMPAVVVVDKKLSEKNQLNEAKSRLAETEAKNGALIDAAVTDGVNNSYRANWKKQVEQNNTLVFNFSNVVGRDVTHIENDGVDFSKRNSAPNKNKVLCSDSDSDSDVDVHRPVPACDVVFVGANAATGKSSIRTKTAVKKPGISFSASLTQIYEYAVEDSAADHNDANHAAHGIVKSNSAIGLSGGLGSYVPNKSQGLQYQLGVARSAPPTASASANSSNAQQTKSSSSSAESEEVLRPTDDAVSWSGSSTSSDLLF